MLAQLQSQESQVIFPQDLNMLQRVFKRYCVEQSLPPESARAENAAASLIQMFRSGTISEIALADAIRLFHDDH